MYLKNITKKIDIAKFVSKTKVDAYLKYKLALILDSLL